MAKKIQMLCFLLILLPALFSVCWAMDYQKMSNQELYELQGAIRNAPEAEQKRYQAEWEQRLATMTDEEKEELLQPEKEKDTDELDSPRTPARGYEEQSGQVIFGGFPGSGGAQ